MFGSKETHLVAVDDLTEAKDAVRQALAGASAAEEPGLRAALAILEGIAGDPQQRWVARVLDRRGIDARDHEVAAIKALRDELPGLSLVAATQLVEAARQERAV